MRFDAKRQVLFRHRDSWASVISFQAQCQGAENQIEVDETDCDGLSGLEQYLWWIFVFSTTLRQLSFLAL